MRRLHLCAIVITIALLGGCATPAPPVERARYAISDFEKADAPRPLAVSDPIEPFNRAMYRFNYHFDQSIFLPVFDAYRLVPNYVRARISSFFDNVGELKNFMNGALQLKPGSAGTSLSRFAINTTVGILGLWDPATRLGLQRQDEVSGRRLVTTASAKEPTWSYRC